VPNSSHLISFSITYTLRCTFTQCQTPKRIPSVELHMEFQLGLGLGLCCSFDTRNSKQSSQCRNSASSSECWNYNTSSKCRNSNRSVTVLSGVFVIDASRPYKDQTSMPSSEHKHSSTHMPTWHKILHYAFYPPLCSNFLHFTFRILPYALCNSTLYQQPNNKLLHKLQIKMAPSKKLLSTSALCILPLRY